MEEKSIFRGASFLILFPRLYHLSSLHNAPISDFMVREGQCLSWNLHFRRNPQDREMGDLTTILGILDTYIYSDHQDRWGLIHIDHHGMSFINRFFVWVADSSGIFSCSSFYKHIQKVPQPFAFRVHNFI